MTSIQEADVPSINPTIALFDELNDTLAYVADMSVGAPAFDKQFFIDDKSEQYYDAVLLLRSKEGMPLRNFMRLCGKIALKDEIDETSANYKKAVDVIVVSPEDEDAVDQAALVIQRFVTKSHMKAFDKLYGNIYGGKAKKPAAKAKSTTPKTVKTVAAPAAELTAKPDAKRPVVSQIIIPRRRQRETALDETSQSTTKVSVAVLAQRVNGFIDGHGGLVSANRVYRLLESLPELDGDRDAIRDVVSSLLAKGRTFKAGAKDGMLYLSSNPERKLEPTATKVSKTELQQESKDDEDLLVHELVPHILSSIQSQGHQNKGQTIRGIALELSVEEDEVRRVVQNLFEIGALSRTARWVRSRSPHSKKKEALFAQFPTQEAWDRYKEDPANYVYSFI